MAPRLQTPAVQFREAVQPVAQVSTTYFQPVVKPKSQLYELAGSLQNFSNDIGGYMDRHKAENDEAALIRGQAAALKANGAELDMGMAEGVRSGLFPAFQSPKFIEGYKRTQGEIMGKKLASQFFSEYQAWDGRNSQNPEDFDNFLGTFISSNLSTDDPEILKGALPFITSTSTAGYNANQQDRSTALYNSSIDAHVASSALDVDNFVDQGIASGAGVDYAGLWEELMDKRSEALSVGVLAADYDKQMLELISAKAIETADPALLSLLDNNVPGQAYTYATSPDGSALTTKTLDAMAINQQQAAVRTKTLQDAADKKALGEAQVEAINALITDPNHVFDEEFLSKVETLDPKFRLDLKQWSENLSKPEPEDEAMVLALQSGIITGQLGMEDIVGEMGADGVIKNPATAQQMMSLLNSTKDNALQPLLTNQTYKDAMTYIQRKLTPDALFGEDVSKEANAARLDYQQAMTSWFKANPDADYNAIAEMSGTVLGRIDKGISADGIGTPEYETPQNLLSVDEGGQAPEQEVDANGRPASDTGIADNPLTTTQQESENAANAQPADDPLEVWRGEQAPAFDQLSPDQQTEIEKRARALGETPDNYILQLYGNLRDNIPEPTTVDGQPIGDQSAVNYENTRNNNPGNLRLSSFTTAQGAIGQDDRGFAVFPTLEAGLMAQRTLLFEDPRYKDLTLDAAIKQYAPSNENDTANYVKVVEQISGVQRGTVMSAMSEAQKQGVLNAFNRMEGSAKPTQGGANFQQVSLRSDVPASSVTATRGASGRLFVQDPTLTSPTFAAQYNAVKGRANYFSGGRNKVPPGNPATAKWQSENLQAFSIAGAGGKKLNLRVYRPAATAFQGFLADLAATGYPIHNVGSANYRLKRGSGTLSEHSYGTAIDVNGETSDYNGDGKVDPTPNPMSAKFMTDLPENVSQLAAKWGLAWGGDWKGTKDTMHFEYTGIPPLKAQTRVASTARSI